MKNLLLILIIGLFNCCKKDPAITSSLSSIKGEWAGGVKNETEEGHDYFFSFCDSTFRVIIKSHYDVVYDHNGCFIAHYNEYASGKYKFVNNVLTLKGFYTDSIYNPKTGGCYNNGVFSFIYPCKFEKNNLYLDPNNSDVHKIIVLKQTSFNGCPNKSN